jgi:hypothetical protein
LSHSKKSGSTTTLWNRYSPLRISYIKEQLPACR